MTIGRDPIGRAPIGREESSINSIVGDVRQGQTINAAFKLVRYITGDVRQGQVVSAAFVPPYEFIIGDVRQGQTINAAFKLVRYIAGDVRQGQVVAATTQLVRYFAGDVRQGQTVAASRFFFGYTGTLSVSFANTLTNPTGSLVVRFANRVYNAGTLAVSFANTLINPTGTLSVNFNNRLYNAGTLSVSFDNRRYTVPTGGSRYFGVSVTLGGADISGKITGDVVVRATEGEARLAEFDMMPAAGAVNPYDWIGRTVTIDYLDKDASGAIIGRHRIFTGLVHLPTYAVTSRLTHFVCTDALQESLELSDRAAVAGIVGGYWSDAVFNDPDNNWDYAQQRMETQAASYDMDANRAPRLTSWNAKATPDFSFTAATVLHDSVVPKLTERRNIVNRVNIAFGLRYGRKWQRELKARWKHGQSFKQWLVDGQTLPSEQMIRDAAGGWLVKSLNSTGLPPTGWYYVNGRIYGWIRPADSIGILEATVVLSNRWMQTITESYAVSVIAPASVTQHGELAVDASYSINAAGERDWENGETYEASTGTKINSTDWIEDNFEEGFARADADTALQTAIAHARTRILAAHRTNGVEFGALLEPRLDTSSTVALTMDEISAQGKVRNFEHRISLRPDGAFATTRLEIAVYQPDVAGQSDDAVAVPSAPDVVPGATTPGSIDLDEYIGGRTSTPQSDDWRGWIGNWFFGNIAPVTFIPEVYENKFVIETPEIVDAERDEAEFAAEQTFNVAIPRDSLTISA